MLLRPPEKPAKKCGSIKPSETIRSASAAALSITRGAPDGSIPISIFFESSWLLCTTIFSLRTISSPSFAISSSSVVGRWKPVAMTSEMSMSGFPSRSSFRIKGTICLLGTGRVWSLKITAAVSAPFAISDSFSLSIGAAIASSTSSSSVLSDASSLTLLTRISAPSGTSRGMPHFA